MNISNTTSDEITVFIESLNRNMNERDYNKVKEVLEDTRVNQDTKEKLKKRVNEIYDKVDTHIRYKILFEDNLLDGLKSKRDEFIKKYYSLHIQAYPEIIRDIVYCNSLTQAEKDQYINEILSHISNDNIKWKILYIDAFCKDNNNEFLNHYIDKILESDVNDRNVRQRIIEILQNNYIDNNIKENFANRLNADLLTHSRIRNLIVEKGINLNQNLRESYNRLVNPNFYNSLTQVYGNQFYIELRNTIRQFLEGDETRCFLQIPVQELGIQPDRQQATYHPVQEPERPADRLQETYNQAIKTVYYTMYEYLNMAFLENYINGLIHSSVLWRMDRYRVEHRVLGINDARTNVRLQGIDTLIPIKDVILRGNYQNETREEFMKFMRMVYPSRQYNKGILIYSGGNQNIRIQPYIRDFNPLVMTTTNGIPDRENFDLVVLIGDRVLDNLPNYIRENNSKIIYIGTSTENQAFLEGCNTVVFTFQEMADWFGYSLPEIVEREIEPTPEISELLNNNENFNGIGRPSIRQVQAYLQTWLLNFNQEFIDEVASRINETERANVRNILTRLRNSDNPKTREISRIISKNTTHVIYIITTRNADEIKDRITELYPWLAGVVDHNVHVIRHYSFKRKISDICYNKNNIENIFIFDFMFRNDWLYEYMKLYAIQGKCYNLQYRRNQISQMIQNQDENDDMQANGYEYNDIGKRNHWFDESENPENIREQERQCYTICLGHETFNNITGKVLNLRTKDYMDVRSVNKGDNIAIYIGNQDRLGQQAREVDPKLYNLGERLSRMWRDYLNQLLPMYGNNTKRLWNALQLRDDLRLERFESYFDPRQTIYFPRKNRILTSILELSVQRQIAHLTEDDIRDILGDIGRFRGMIQGVGNNMKDEELDRKRGNPAYTSEFLREGIVRHIESNTYNL